jgi:hypothetical protein
VKHIQMIKRNSVLCSVGYNHKQHQIGDEQAKAVERTRERERERDAQVRHGPHTRTHARTHARTHTHAQE